MADDHALAGELAEQAGQRLLELRSRGGSGDKPDVLRKAGDRLSHEFLVAELARRRPGDVVLSEEAADDPARLAAQRVWIVDPLDGTREFGEPGRTDWAVHVALWDRGRGRAAGPGLRLVHHHHRLRRRPGARRRPRTRRPAAAGRGEPDSCTTVRSGYFRHD
jgi:3'(2'), 5'-bisphosphate nucleotidase